MKLIENAYINLRKRLWKDSLPQAWDGRSEGQFVRLNEEKIEPGPDDILDPIETPNYQKVFSRSELIHATNHGFYPGKNGHLYRHEDLNESNPHHRSNDSYVPIASLKKPVSFPIHNSENELPHIEIAGKNARHWDRLDQLDAASDIIHYYSDQEAETHRGMNNLLRKESGNFKPDETDRYIHNDPDHVIRSKIKDFSDLIKNAPHKPKSDFYVYTGLGKRTDMHEIMTDSKETKAVHFPGFTSTSVDPRVTINFTHPKKNIDSAIKFGDHQEVEDVLKIKIPAGHQRGLYISHDSLNSVVGDEEKEYVLDKSHVIHVHPEPEYHVGNNCAVTRLWHAHVNKDGD